MKANLVYGKRLVPSELEIDGRLAVLEYDHMDDTTWVAYYRYMATDSKVMEVTGKTDAEAFYNMLKQLEEENLITYTVYTVSSPEDSKKLSEILGRETCDMYWLGSICGEDGIIFDEPRYELSEKLIDGRDVGGIPCWTADALHKMLPRTLNLRQCSAELEESSSGEMITVSYNPERPDTVGHWTLSFTGTDSAEVYTDMLCELAKYDLLASDKIVVDAMVKCMNELLGKNNLPYTESLHNMITERFGDIADEAYRKSLGKLR